MRRDFGPQAISATFAAAAGVLTVTFDLPLVGNPALAIGNWTLCDGFNFRNWASMVAAGHTVTGTANAFLGAVCGLPRLGFTPPPFDLVGMNGHQVEVFTMPVSLLP